MLKFLLMSLVLFGVFGCKTSSESTFMYVLNYKDGAFKIDINATCVPTTYDEKYKAKWCKKIDDNFECEDAQGAKVSFREFQTLSMCESAVSMRKRENVDFKD